MTLSAQLLQLFDLDPFILRTRFGLRMTLSATVRVCSDLPLEIRLANDREKLRSRCKHFSEKRIGFIHYYHCRYHYCHYYY